MAQSKASDGWYLIANSWQYTTIYSADDVPICRLDLEDWGVNEDNQSDLETEQEQVANLIAAAPDLLEALILLEREMVLSGNAQSKDYGWLPAIEKTRAAIARAEGRAANTKKELRG